MEGERQKQKRDVADVIVDNLYELCSSEFKKKDEKLKASVQLPSNNPRKKKGQVKKGNADLVTGANDTRAAGSASGAGGPGGRAKRHRADDEDPVRRPNVYFFFVERQRKSFEKSVKKERPELKGLETSRAVNQKASQVWAKLSEQKKQQWKARSIADWKQKSNGNPTPATKKRKTTCKPEGHSNDGKVEIPLSDPLPGTSQPLKSLRPVLKTGAAVYAAFWSNEDKARTSVPDWYPGVVTSCESGRNPVDRKYGPVRYYNVKYDDGDRLTGIPDHFVMAKLDYELHLRHDGECGRGKTPSWKGVVNITDPYSKDKWAQHVGWYVATIDGAKHNFSQLAQAVRAATKKSSLNLPEDWKDLLTTKQVPVSVAPSTTKGETRQFETTSRPSVVKARAIQQGKFAGGSVAELPVSHTEVIEPAAYIGLQRKRVHLRAAGGTSHPSGESFNAVSDTKQPSKQQMSSKTPKSASPWTLKEYQLIIEIDDRCHGMLDKDKCKKMAEKLPGFTQKRCNAEIMRLRELARCGKDIEAILGISSIQSTLAKWRKEEIDMLVTLEDKCRGEEEDTKNAKIAQAIPRWESDQCSFKTRCMRWRVRLQKEGDKKRKKEFWRTLEGQAEIQQAVTEWFAGRSKCGTFKDFAGEETFPSRHFGATAIPTLLSARRQSCIQMDIL